MNLIFTYSGKTLSPPALVLYSTYLRGVRRDISFCKLPLTTEAKYFLITSAFSSIFTHWPFDLFCGWHTCRNFSCYSLGSLPISAPDLPCPSWSYPYKTRLSPCTLPRMPVHDSTASAFASCPLVWPEVPFSQPLSVLFFSCPSFCSCAQLVLWFSCFFVTEGSFQGGPINQVLEELKFLLCGSAERLIVLFTWHISLCKLHWYMITAAQGASNLDIPDWLVHRWPLDPVLCPLWLVCLLSGLRIYPPCILVVF